MKSEKRWMRMSWRKESVEMWIENRKRHGEKYNREAFRVR
jgi:hypothetical protein